MSADLNTEAKAEAALNLAAKLLELLANKDLISTEELWRTAEAASAGNDQVRAVVSQVLRDRRGEERSEP